MNSEKIKKALRMAVNVGCGFEGDAEDAASLLSLIETNEARIDDLEIEVKELRRGYSPSRKPEKNKVVLVDYKGTLYFGLFNDRGTWETAYRDNIRQYSGIRRWWELPEVQE